MRFDPVFDALDCYIASQNWFCGDWCVFFFRMHSFLGHIAMVSSVYAISSCLLLRFSDFLVCFRCWVSVYCYAKTYAATLRLRLNKFSIMLMQKKKRKKSILSTWLILGSCCVSHTRLPFQLKRIYWYIVHLVSLSPSLSLSPVVAFSCACLRTLSTFIHDATL